MLTHAKPGSKVIYTNLSPISFNTLNSYLKEEENKTASGHCHSESITKIMDNENISKSRVCLLDPKAPKEISPEDINQFDYYLFGGILGDDPPRDRTKELRKFEFEGRHLGPRQMSTDTALGVTKMVIKDQIKLQDIKFIDDPTITFSKQESVDMPYRYIQKENGEPLMAPGMLEHIRDDMNKSFI